MRSIYWIGAACSIALLTACAAQPTATLPSPDAAPAASGDSAPATPGDGAPSPERALADAAASIIFYNNLPESREAEHLGEVHCRVTQYGWRSRSPVENCRINLRYDAARLGADAIVITQGFQQDAYAEIFGEAYRLDEPTTRQPTGDPAAEPPEPEAPDAEPVEPEE